MARYEMSFSELKFHLNAWKIGIWQKSATEIKHMCCNHNFDILKHETKCNEKAFRSNCGKNTIADIHVELYENV